MDGNLISKLWIGGLYLGSLTAVSSGQEPLPLPESKNVEVVQVDQDGNDVSVIVPVGAFVARPEIARPVENNIAGENAQKEQNEEEQQKALKRRVKAATWFGHLTSRIGEMTAVCQLSKPQVERLKLAARGAVNQLVKHTSKELKKTRLCEELKVYEIGDTIHIGRNYEFTFLDQEPVWKRTIVKTLTKEQTQAWTAWVERRLKVDRIRALYEAAAAVEHVMSLTQTQREQLVELVDEELINRRIVITSSKHAMITLGVTALQLTETELKSVLTPKQVSIWKQTLSEELDGEVEEILPMIIKITGRERLALKPAKEENVGVGEIKF